MLYVALQYDISVSMHLNNLGSISWLYNIMSLIIYYDDVIKPQLKSNNYGIAITGELISCVVYMVDKVI